MNRTARDRQSAAHTSGRWLGRRSAERIKADRWPVGQRHIVHIDPGDDLWLGSRQKENCHEERRQHEILLLGDERGCQWPRVGLIVVMEDGVSRFTSLMRRLMVRVCCLFDEVPMNHGRPVMRPMQMLDRQQREREDRDPTAGRRHDLHQSRDKHVNFTLASATQPVKQSPSDGCHVDVATRGWDRLPRVRRPLSTCLALLMLWAFARPATMHVHAQEGHDAVAHSHGVSSSQHQHQRASHTHSHAGGKRHTHGVRHAAHAPATKTRATAAHAEHPAGHTLYLKLTTTSAAKTFAAPFIPVATQTLAIEPPRVLTFFRVEPRQHGPPQCANVPARAPPSVLSA